MIVNKIHKKAHTETIIKNKRQYARTLTSCFILTYKPPVKAR